MKNTANDEFLVGSSVEDLSTRTTKGTFAENPSAWILSNLKQLGWTVLVVVGVVVGFRYYQELQESKKGEQVFRLSQILSQLTKVASTKDIKPEELTGITDSIKIFKSEAPSGSNDLANSLVNLIEAKLLVLKGEKSQAITKLEQMNKIDIKKPDLANELASLSLARIYLDESPETFTKGRELLFKIVSEGEFACVDALKALDTLSDTASEKERVKQSATDLIKRRPDMRKQIGTFLNEFNDGQLINSEPFLVE